MIKQTPTPHTLSVISNRQLDWGPLFWGVYITAGVLLAALFACLNAHLPVLYIKWIGAAAILSCFTAFALGAPYRIMAHLTFEGDRSSVEWRTGRQMEFPLHSVEQLLVRIGSAAGDGELVSANRLTIGRSGLDNYLDCVSEWGIYAFKFRLDKTDIPP